VYGIVNQYDGFITAQGVLGQGTPFKIYLPPHPKHAVAAIAAIAVEIPGSRGETILLVENELTLLTMIGQMLELRGYTVLTASTPDEAIRLAGEYKGVINLLMTDVVMPGMNGCDMVKQIKSVRSAIKCLFMSGYTADVIAHHGVLEAGVQFIQKPFSVTDLETKIRAVLENTPNSGSGKV
ncbi:MAG: response regulator, partial [Candidatus Riflebacteria bacterium]|nr:response regulator [Candidatus Riflebacteria bacterium]